MDVFFFYFLWKINVLKLLPSKIQMHRIEIFIINIWFQNLLCRQQGSASRSKQVLSFEQDGPQVERARIISNPIRISSQTIDPDGDSVHLLDAVSSVRYAGLRRHLLVVDHRQSSTVKNWNKKYLSWDKNVTSKNFLENMMNYATYNVFKII